MPKKTLIWGSIVVGLWLAGCTLPSSSTSSGPVLTHLIPVVAFNTNVTSKAAIPASMNFNDISYFVNCPALTGFVTSASGVTEGQVLPSQAFLNTTVTFTAATFSGGTNGIVSGTRFTGVLADGSGTLVIELNPAGTQIWFAEKFFLDDPNGVSSTPSVGSMKYVIRQVYQGQLDPSDQSCIATGNFWCYFVYNSGSQAAVGSGRGELYLGPWDSSAPGVTGSGLARLTSAVNSSPAASYNSVPQPTGTLDSSKIDAAVAYVNAFMATNPTPAANVLLAFKTSVTTSPTVFLSGDTKGWGGAVLITTPALAKANLPSAAWRAKSSLDTF